MARLSLHLSQWSLLSSFFQGSCSRSSTSKPTHSLPLQAIYNLQEAEEGAERRLSNISLYCKNSRIIDSQIKRPVETSESAVRLYKRLEECIFHMQQKSSAHLQGGKHCVQSIEVILLFFSVKYQKLISHVQHLVLKIYSYCIFLQSSFDLYVWKKFRF